MTFLISGIIASGRCRVVVISGRSIEDLSRLVKFDPMPEMWGCHGWERLLPGEKHLVRGPGPDVDSFLGKASEWAIENGLEGRFEIKPVSIAFHWRGAGPGLDERISGMVRSGLLEEAEGAGMEMRRFSGGVELIMSGVNKGSAVDSVLGEYGEGAAVAYLGDDNTDEYAFRALGGRGLSVLVSGELRETAADIWIRPPGELISFLETWAEACGVEV